MGILGKIVDGIKNIYYIVKEKICRAFVRVKDALSRFFEKALNMMKIVVQKIAPKVVGVLLGSSHFLRKIGNIYQEGTKNYSLDEELGEWNETTVTRKIALEDVPPQYRGMENEDEINDTHELDNSLIY